MAGSAATAQDNDEGGEVGAGKRQSKGGDEATSKGRGGGRRRSHITGVDGCGPRPEARESACRCGTRFRVEKIRNSN